MIIVGAGETARLMTYYLEREGLNVEFYIVDPEYKTDNDTLLGRSIITFDEKEKLLGTKSYLFMVAITTARKLKAREDLFYKMTQYDFTPYTFVSKMAFVDGFVDVGSFIFENNVIQDSSYIGKNCILWSGNHIGHGTEVGNHCFISSHVVLCGGVKVGNNCFFGVNSAVAPGVKIGDNCAIGMGTTIMRDVPQDTVIRGVDSRDSILAQPHSLYWD